MPPGLDFGIQGWIGVYRNKHSFLYPPKRKSAESRDVLVKSRGLEGKISSDPYFSFRVENPFCFPFFFKITLICDGIQKSRKPKVGCWAIEEASIHRRARTLSRRTV